jgi:hypothetical protein
MNAGTIGDFLERATLPILKGSKDMDMEDEANCWTIAMKKALRAGGFGLIFRACSLTPGDLAATAAGRPRVWRKIQTMEAEKRRLSRSG